MVHPNSYPGRWPAPEGPLRITLVPDFGTAALDGIWRPYSTDLLCEAPHLINQFPVSRGRLDRLACSPTDWDQLEPYVFTSFGRIPIGQLPPEYLHVVLCRIFGGPVIRLGIQRAWRPAGPVQAGATADADSRSSTAATARRSPVSAISSP